MISEAVKIVAGRIGQFFLNKNDGDYAKTEQDIAKMRINNISITEDDKVVIELSRPGILIGRRGEQIDSLTKYLGQSVHIVETNEHIYDYLVPRDYSDY